MKITRANNKAIEYACKHFHYAKAVPVNTLGYNVYNQNGDWCGVVLFGMGANNHIGNEYGLNQGQIYELVRVALNGKQECTSQAVAMTLKQIHKDCPLCRLIVSYADCDQNHLGTIYQATNWVYVGLKNENTRGGFIVNGKKTHPKSIYSIKIGNGKHCPQNLEAIKKYIDPNATEYITKGKRKYLYALDKKMKKQIAKLALPYPKIDADWQKIDRKMFDKKD